jgi:hypothetical protein
MYVCISTLFPLLSKEKKGKAAGGGAMEEEEEEEEPWWWKVVGIYLLQFKLFGGCFIHLISISSSSSAHLSLPFMRPNLPHFLLPLFPLIT